MTKKNTTNQEKMKIAISSTGESIDDEIDSRFGRCPYFLVIEARKEEGISDVKVMENIALEQVSGAGITVGQMIGNEKPDAIITVNMGPKAFQVFEKLEIDIYSAKGNIKQAVEDFFEGKLEKMNSLNGPMQRINNNF